MNEKDLRKVSKFLSFILRHNPQSIGLTLDSHGWADVGELIAKSKEIKLNKKMIDEVVKNDSKQRYVVEDNRIRANQGHSITIDLGLKAIVPPDVLYHGTARRFLDSIMKTGLSRQQRHHVHLSQDKQMATSVGSRHGKVVLLEIDAKQMHKEGYEFYLSANGVWLSDVVPVGFIQKI
ncbi:MAG: RNA 2'-phosphotransferase [Sulfurovaceae bacterium]|nr:RNA 2'-phosphotransferase [Sulfurovaceae bacterium]